MPSELTSVFPGDKVGGMVEGSINGSVLPRSIPESQQLAASTFPTASSKQPSRTTSSDAGEMAASVTSCNFSVKPDVFRYYPGPHKSKRDSKRGQAQRLRVDPSPNIPWTDIDDLLSPAELDAFPKFEGEALERGAQGTCVEAQFAYRSDDWIF
jgi:hypothetical protein